MHMAHTSATILEARRAVLTLATALVASTIASAAVITGMMAVIDGGAATSKSYSSYWTAVTRKESGKHVPMKRVVHARSIELAPTPFGHGAGPCADPVGILCGRLRG